MMRDLDRINSKQLTPSPGIKNFPGNDGVVDIPGAGNKLFPFFLNF